MLFKFLKYGIVGFSGMVIDFSITFLLKEKLKIHRYVASSTGFALAATSNWFFNRLWTFESSNPKIFAEYSTFIIISLLGLGVNNLFLWLFEKRMKFYPAKLCAIAVTTIWNFVANYYLTFSQ
jgi:putative flippase GtrA